MSTIFRPHGDVLADHRDFVGSFVLITDERIGPFVRQLLEEEQSSGRSRWCNCRPPTAWMHRWRSWRGRGC